VRAAQKMSKTINAMKTTLVSTTHHGAVVYYLLLCPW
jgi:hypothetical protein